MKEFEVLNKEIVIYVKVIRDELHDTDRNLVVVHRFGDDASKDICRLVEPYKIMDVVYSYLQ